MNKLDKARDYKPKQYSHSDGKHYVDVDCYKEHIKLYEEAIMYLEIDRNIFRYEVEKLRNILNKQKKIKVDPEIIEQLIYNNKY